VPVAIEYDLMKSAQEWKSTMDPSYNKKCMRTWRAWECLVLD